MHTALAMLIAPSALTKVTSFQNVELSLLKGIVANDLNVNISVSLF